MRQGDKQRGAPFEEYTDTKTNIEALTGVGEGAHAFATDAHEPGWYDGSNWHWFGCSQVIFTVEGEVNVTSGSLKVTNHTGRTLTLVGVYLDIATAPTGDDLVGDILMDGTSIFSSGSDCPMILDGEVSGSSIAIGTSAWANQSYLTMGITQVGSTAHGSHLVIAVVYY